jgi:hypothetical protein
MAANQMETVEITDSPIPALNKSSPMNQSVTSTGSDEIFNSTLLNCPSVSPNITLAPLSTSRLAVKTDKNKRRSFSPYKFPLRTPEISPIEKQLADSSLMAAPQTRKFLTPKAPRDQFVTIRGNHAVLKKNDVSLKEKRPKVSETKSRTKSMDKAKILQVKVSPNTLFASPSENGGSDKSSNGSIKNTSGLSMSSSEVMEQTLCVESVLKDLSLIKYMDIFIAEEVSMHFLVFKMAANINCLPLHRSIFKCF